jgi:uncharacterized protein (TIGR02302 family)
MAEPQSRLEAHPPAFARRLVLARLAIFCEDLLVRLWRAAAIGGVFLGLSLLGFWLLLPGIVHVTLLVAFAVAFGWVLARDLPGLGWPSQAAGLRRLEIKSGFDHRPLLALDDSYAGDKGDDASRALFEAHRQRMRQRLRALRVGWPHSRVARADRFALRAFGVLILAAGLIAGWQEARANLAAAVAPDFSRGLIGADPVGQVTLWITPPAYTGIPPIWLDAAVSQDVDRPIAVPAGSELVVQVRGGTQAPEVLVGGEATAFEDAGPGSYQISMLLTRGERLAILQSDQELAAWPIHVIPDALPVVALAQPPQETLRTGLRLDVEASDDYGIESIVGNIHLVDRPDGPPLQLLIPIAHAGITQTSGPSFFSLMVHPWAGMEVTLQLVATDMLGQEGRSEPVTFSLPERFFFNPVAREIADRRKDLVRDPATAPVVADALLELTGEPAAFLDDASVFLGLNIAASRLTSSEDVSAGRQDVVDLMWDMAVDVEEGPLAFAEQRVQELQESLMEALLEGAADAEIEQLIDQLRQAMEDYMRALSNRLRTDPGELFDPTDALKAVGSKELTDLVEQIRDLVRTGSREQAQTLLNRLQEIMENISVGNLSDLTGAMSPEATEVLQTIRQLMAGQQELLDQTFRLLRDSGNGDPDSQQQFVEQEQLLSSLQDLMSRMQSFGFDVSREFDRAERSMTRAARQLEADRPGQAIDHETAAVDQLRAGTDELMQDLIEQSGEDGAGEGKNFLAAPRDPMGRNMGGAGALENSDLELPEHGALMRAREILEELYRRAGEQGRPPGEQEYLQRLLRRF